MFFYIVCFVFFLHTIYVRNVVRGFYPVPSITIYTRVSQLSYTRHLAWITDHYTRTQLGRMIMMGHNHMCVRPAASSNHGISANSIVFDFVSSLLSRLDLGAGNWSTLDLNP